MKKTLTVVKVATIQQKKVIHDNFMFQKDETSSMANSKPPTGAPNADATPAPAPAEMKFRLKGSTKLSSSLDDQRRRGRCKWRRAKVFVWRKRMP